MYRSVPLLCIYEANLSQTWVVPFSINIRNLLMCSEQIELLVLDLYKMRLNFLFRRLASWSISISLKSIF